MASPREFRHEFPDITRALHFVHAFGICIFIITGIFIRWPIWEGGRYVVRAIHYALMAPITIIYFWRVGWAFRGWKKDYHDFAPRKLDLQVAPKTILYYAFIGKSYPHLQKFNPLQKMTYLLFFLMMPFQIYTGAVLVFPQPFAWPFAWIFGGIAGTVAWMRWLHYCGMLFFGMFTMIHIYLALTENFFAFSYFFYIPLFGEAKRLFEEGPKEHGHGAHGDNENSGGGHAAPEGSH